MAALCPEYEYVRAPILTKNEVPSLYEVYPRVQHISLNSRSSSVSSGEMFASVSSGNGRGEYIKAR